MFAGVSSCMPSKSADSAPLLATELLLISAALQTLSSSEPAFPHHWCANAWPAQQGLSYLRKERAKLPRHQAQPSTGLLQKGRKGDGRECGAVAAFQQAWHAGHTTRYQPPPEEEAEQSSRENKHTVGWGELELAASMAPAASAASPWGRQHGWSPCAHAALADCSRAYSSSTSSTS